MTQEELASELLHQLTGHYPATAVEDYQAILKCFKAVKALPLKPKRNVLRCLDCGDIIELTSPRMLIVCNCGRSSICSWHKPPHLSGNYEDLSE